MSASKKSERWFIFQNERLLILKDSLDDPLLSSKAMSEFTNYFLRQHKLATLENTDIYCAELPLDITLPTHIETISLRKALELLQTDWYTIAAKAYSIINWDKNHHYCGRCGNLTVRASTTFERKCEHCAIAFYPRISPTIIVLIKKDDHVLMARSPHFPPGIYALIAGFVEAGESLEDAVHREVKEEIGIEIKNLTFFGSQSWPFPDSLMVAFFADYAGGDLVLNHDEIEAAGWYRYDQLPGRPSSALSISSKLLDHYLAEQKQKALK